MPATNVQKYRNFGEAVSMDVFAIKLKSNEKAYILSMVDMATRLTALRILRGTGTEALKKGITNINIAKPAVSYSFLIAANKMICRSAPSPH